MYLPPGHPIIAIRKNRNQNGRRIGKKVYFGSSGLISKSLINNFLEIPAVQDENTSKVEIVC